MQRTQLDPDAIAEEAVGQLRGSTPPDGVKQQAEMPLEEMARRSNSAGAQASIPEKTAESIGERVGNAYADPGSGGARNPPAKSARLRLPREGSRGNRAADPLLASVRQVAQVVSDQLDEQPFRMVLASFALGYMTALVLHGRR